MATNLSLSYDKNSWWGMGVNRMGICRHVLEYIFVIYHDFIHPFFYIYATVWYMPGFDNHVFLILK